MSNMILNAFCGHLSSNYNASLGYGNDKEVIINACEDFEWLLDYMEITAEDVAKAFEEYK